MSDIYFCSNCPLNEVYQFIVNETFYIQYKEKRIIDECFAEAIKKIKEKICCICCIKACKEAYINIYGECFL
jgi:hypothetical protein